VAKRFYESQDVGIMSNKCQKVFGLSDIHDKFEFRGVDFSLSAAHIYA
jgi:hypothetical protein